MTVFADGLHCPTGFEFYNGGVLVAQAPDLHVPQGHQGRRQGRPARARAARPRLGRHAPHRQQLRPRSGRRGLLPGRHVPPHAGGDALRPAGAQRRTPASIRYEPRTQKFDVYVTYGFANPHGHVFDRWGQDIVVDGTGANPYHGTLFSGHVDFPQKHGKPPQVYQQRTRPCPGMEILSSRHFPEENQGNLLVANVIGFQGILQYKLKDKGASLAGERESSRSSSSSDPNFRPSDIKIGPDGAI